MLRLLLRCALLAELDAVSRLPRGISWVNAPCLFRGQIAGGARAHSGRLGGARLLLEGRVAATLRVDAQLRVVRLQA